MYFRLSGESLPVIPKWNIQVAQFQQSPLTTATIVIFWLKTWLQLWLTHHKCPHTTKCPHHAANNKAAKTIPSKNKQQDLAMHCNVRILRTFTFRWKWTTRSLRMWRDTPGAHWKTHSSFWTLSRRQTWNSRNRRRCSILKGPSSNLFLSRRSSFEI